MEVVHSLALVQLNFTFVEKFRIASEASKLVYMYMMYIQSVDSLPHATPNYYFSANEIDCSILASTQST